MEKQLRLYSVLEHDMEHIQEKTRKKISKKEKMKRGDFIANKSKDGVKKILEDIRRKDTILDRFKLRNRK